jgi:uncharacterized protein (TIGR03435 family)
MLRSLLSGRYKLKMHTEDRPMPASVLVAIKPKLDKTDPAARIGCHEASGSAPGRFIACQNVTMQQFADILPVITQGDVRAPVFDATGIEGAWQFSFHFVPVRQLAAAAARKSGEVPPDRATDPVGGYSIFDALTKQLGLKVESQKRPLPVLAIDSIER